MKIGIIAEDDSDVAVVKQLTLTLLTPLRIGFRPFVGDGCGKLRRKCRAWAELLVGEGCPWIVVVHDLDTNDEAGLRKLLFESVSAARPQVSVVLLPKHEIEAWLLYDARAIASAFNERKLPKLPSDPEAIRDPKQHLRDLVWRTYRKRYLNSLHNSKIAEGIEIRRLKASKSFSAHPQFTERVRASWRDVRWK